MLAVYDFAVSRIAFDFFNYLALADLARRHAGAENLTLLTVPADGDGFRPNVQYDLDQKRWRLRNIVVDGAPLLPACSGVLQAASRDHARALIAAHDGPIHPRGYSLEAPVGHGDAAFLTIAANFGEDVQVLRASAQARAYARQWVDARRQGRPAVAITLREAQHTAQRNSTLDDWAEVARALEARGYFPFVMRDIETALSPPTPALTGIAECPAAVFNLDLRLGFYEASHLNIFVFAGPMGLAQLSRNVRFLGFAVEPDSPVVQKYYEDIGFAFDESPPYLTHLQRYVWRFPTPAVVIEEFDAMAERLRAHEASGAPSADYELDPVYRREPDIIARHLFNARNWQSFDALVTECERRGLGSIELSAVKAEADRERAALADDERIYRQAAKLRSAGDLDAAIGLLQALVERRPSEIRPYIDLGLALEAAGRIRDAESLYRAAIARRVAPLPIIYRLGCIAQGLGDLDDARACFEMLLAKAGDDDGVVIVDARARLAQLTAGPR